MTARHLLGQTSGVGQHPPGTAWTYDSETYIMHLSYLLGKVTGKMPIEWATSEFAAPLGLPTLYDNDDVGPDISAGGGQMLSCRDHVRFGQLLVNGGLWKSGDSTKPPLQIVEEDYVKAVLTPSFPAVSGAYGLLTWLGQPVTNHTAKCCAPRWGTVTSCKGSRLDASILGDDMAKLPGVAGVGIGMGW